YSVGSMDHLLGERDVLLERQHRAVDHHRSEAAVYRGQYLFVVRTMIPVDRYRYGGTVSSFLYRGDHLHADVPHLVGVDTQDHRGILLLADVDDAEEHRIVADVEGGHREVVFVRDVQDHL